MGALASSRTDRPVGSSTVQVPALGVTLSPIPKKQGPDSPLHNERSTIVVTIFYERDAKPETLKGKTIAILGYGSQGHAQAQNLRDSGHKVIVGLDLNRQSAQQARADGMVVVAPDEAAKRADWIQVLTPDETQAALYEKSIKPYLHPGKVLG